MNEQLYERRILDAFLDRANWTKRYRVTSPSRERDERIRGHWRNVMEGDK
jgi:hypothetical protein